MTKGNNAAPAGLTVAPEHQQLQLQSPPAALTRIDTAQTLAVEDMPLLISTPSTNSTSTVVTTSPSAVSTSSSDVHNRLDALKAGMGLLPNPPPQPMKNLMHPLNLRLSHSPNPRYCYNRL